MSTNDGRDGLRPNDPAQVVVRFAGFSQFVAFFSGCVDMLNVQSMATMVGGLPGMPDEQEEPNVQLVLEFRNAELAMAWCRDNQQRLVLDGSSYVLEPLKRQKPTRDLLRDPSP